MRNVLIVVLGVGLLMSACGDDGTAADDTAADDTAADDTAVDDTAADDTAADDTAVDDTAVDDTAADDTAADDTAADDTTTEPEPDPGAAQPVAVDMSEFVIDAPTSYPAGALEITAANNGQFSHELNIVAGTYAELPQEPSGEVIEDGLEFIVELEPIEPGDSQTVVVDLEPGTYVFFCNIAIGPNSHAGAGQTLDVTVTG